MRNLYLFPNGRVGALEKDLLNARTWQMLLSAADGAEAARLLADTWYGRFPGLAQGSFESVFDAAQAATEQELVELAEDQGLIRGILHRRDARNARYIWKAALCGPVGAIPELERPGMFEHSVLEAALADEGARSLLPRAMASAAEKLSGMPSPTPLEIDSVLDAMAVELELEELPGMEPGFRRFLEALVDMRNLMICLRLVASGRKAGITPGALFPGGSASREALAAAALEGTLPDLVSETGNLERLGPLVREAVSSRSFLELERESDRILMDMLDAGSFELFGPAPLAAFLLKREMEISHLRILLSAKSAGIDRARLQRRLPRG